MIVWQEEWYWWHWDLNCTAFVLNWGSDDPVASVANRLSLPLHSCCCYSYYCCCCCCCCWDCLLPSLMSCRQERDVSPAGETPIQVSSESGSRRRDGHTTHTHSTHESLLVPCSLLTVACWTAPSALTLISNRQSSGESSQEKEERVNASLLFYWKECWCRKKPKSLSVWGWCESAPSAVSSGSSQHKLRISDRRQHLSSPCKT